MFGTATRCCRFFCAPSYTHTRVLLMRKKRRDGYAVLEPQQEITLNTIIYIVGLVVVIGAVLAFFGLR